MYQFSIRYWKIQSNTVLFGSYIWYHCQILDFKGGFGGSLLLQRDKKAFKVLEYKYSAVRLLTKPVQIAMNPKMKVYQHAQTQQVNYICTYI